MCNLGEGIRERAFAQAFAQAELSTKTQSIIDLMDSMGIDVEKAMQLLKIREDDMKYYREKIDEQLVAK